MGIGRSRRPTAGLKQHGWAVAACISVLLLILFLFFTRLHGGRGTSGEPQSVKEGQDTFQVALHANEALTRLANVEPPVKTAAASDTEETQEDDGEPEVKMASGGKPRLKPWAERAVTRRICTNTCSNAKNGVCEDGREGRGRVWCDLGTDCEDCGAWVARVPASRHTGRLPKPIAMLVGDGIEVYVRDTVTQPPFRMAFTNATLDTDVSAQLAASGAVEVGLTQVWWQQLSEGGPTPCLQVDGRRGLVADVGGNFGWYTLYAALLGCRVMVWEPVPQFRAFLEYGLQLNHLMGLVDVHAAVIADKAGEQYEVIVPRTGVWGTAGIGGANVGLHGTSESYKVKVDGERLDEQIQEPVALLKMDVEGYEPTAFESARKVFEKYGVENVVLEYSPGIWEKSGRTADYDVWPKMLLQLLDWGFTLFHISWGVAKKMLGPDDLAKGFPVIKRENLLYDLADAHIFTKGDLNCPIPETLKDRPWWDRCNNMQFDMHPKSFHSTFNHNTNVLAVKNATRFALGPPAATFPLDQADTDYFSKSGMGLLGFTCEYVEETMKVRIRCPCPVNATCQDTARLAEEAWRTRPPRLPETT